VTAVSSEAESDTWITALANSWTDVEIDWTF